MDNRCIVAFRNNNKEEAVSLLKEVKDPRKVKNRLGLTPLHCAAAHDWTDIMELLITIHKCDVNCRTVNNWTPVHEASMRGHLDAVKYLYNTGKCDLFIKDKYGKTPLDIARQLGQHEIVEFITNVITCTLTCK